MHEYDDEANGRTLILNRSGENLRSKIFLGPGMTPLINAHVVHLDTNGMRGPVFASPVFRMPVVRRSTTSRQYGKAVPNSECATSL